MLKSQDVVVALGVIIALVVVLFGVSAYHAPVGEPPKTDSASMRQVAPEPESAPGEEQLAPEAPPSNTRTDSLTIVRVSLPARTAR